MVDEAVDHGGGHDFVAEHFTPAAKGLVGGDDQAGAFVAGRDQLKEQVGGFGFERAPLCVKQPLGYPMIDGCDRLACGGKACLLFVV